MPAIIDDQWGNSGSGPFLFRLWISRHVRLALAALNLLALLALAELVSAAPPTEKGEREAYQWLCEVLYEKNPGIQASPNWCEACKALGSTRNPELVTSLERYIWREDARVKNDHSLEHYPALWALAEIGTPALPTLARAIRSCEEERQAKVLAAALAKLYGNQRFAESYLRSQLRQAREAGQESQAANVQRVLKVFKTAG